MKNNRYDDFAQAIAGFICLPVDAIEIGGVSSQLIDIIRTQTKNNRSIRKEVHDWIECKIELGHAIDIYVENPKLAKVDYDILFYK